ncbi:FUSC family protein [Pseudoroseomonas wenyumeiae]|uniref:FUSC family protein n=1 Tax=Teichococcus wenyumeiae TaxID=2478470 RepID=A0A3A9K0H1_9PROT|nr:FUSC family protein [Pseudoroseomonas wenyumeiae]RKK04849.1 FUSC family protein [Pseudoroseomonas wenyumeiae]RMI20516.1 FUSC family protein [Pseudoroseomonas wenyumeiae]
MTSPGLARLGFDPARMSFALRTALGACLGLLLAWLMGLEHPQWTAMSVWAASQPTRGLLIEKGFFRAGGTVVGVIVGLLLILASQGHPLLMVLGLSIWIGICAGLGNVLHGFMSYGAILAGYSASMVALLDAANPGSVLLLGIDRLLTVLLGVLVATLVGLALTPREAEDAVVGGTRRLLARLLRAMAARLSGEADGLDQRATLSEMASIDEALDRHGAGSLRTRRSARLLRGVLAAQVPALLWLRNSRHVGSDAAVAHALARAADALESAAPVDTVLPALQQAEELSAGQPPLHEVIAGLHAALHARLRPGEKHLERPSTLYRVVVHRDWVGARQAGLRAAGTLLLLGLGWLLSGWGGGPYVMLGTSVMITVFSTAENPALTMRAIFLGQVFGATAALICRWLAWPLAGSEFQMILLTMPFIIMGVLPSSHRRTIAGALDYNMIMLLLLQPSFPLVGSFSNSLTTAAAVVAAPLIAMAAFRFAFPADARRRMRVLMGMMVHELQDMAAHRPAIMHDGIWQARLYHRLLRLVRWAEKTGEQPLPVANGSLAVMQVGSAIVQMQALLRQPGLPPGIGRALDATLRRLQRIGQDPVRAQRSLATTARRLFHGFRPAAESLAISAEALLTNLSFFQQASKGPPPPKQG